MTLSKRLYPAAVIGIIGGGQLGKMLAQSAQRMGYKVAVLDPSADAPARSVCHTFIHADFSDEEALIKLSDMSDVVTYEFENIDAHILRNLVSDYYVPQGAKTVLTLQNRTTEKNAIKESGASIVPFENISSEEDVKAFAKKHSYPLIVKTTTGGYDGKGQYYIGSEQELSNENIPFEKTEFIVEKYINLSTEVSLTAARSASGEIIYFPLQENLHRNQVLYRTIAPARVDYFEKAKAEADKIMEAMLFVGVFTIEFFIDQNGELYVNEIAPRPHNSAHYTIEACNISQFDAHILSVTDQPLPEVYQHSDAIMMNLLGEDLDRLDLELFDYSEWNVHLYGKSDRKAARKMGHVTILTDDVEAELEKLKTNFEKQTD
ncbi:MAG TPA: 5-(carboxyamino)imidazole ribonucleotide synthase [Jeotgalicoccus sp.]|jgi:5-(carboxyamino)imidazole ribonucleotide synthase|nr:5-(carboxyamino)imidazole ribonucleotide synthase [Jeotgalicoccus sp.]HBV24033.1 5-(carboxyamino)imidazole ribonucleotide synthase [Jeotgalicoccus sp.]